MQMKLMMWPNVVDLSCVLFVNAVNYMYAYISSELAARRFQVTHRHLS